MIQVRLEILSSLVEALDGERKGDAVSFIQEVEAGDTVLDLLNRLAASHQKFGQVVFDGKAQKLTEKANIFLNGRNLELANGLATELGDGDVVTFVAPVVGG